jgi:hypothetical protein
MHAELMFLDLLPTSPSLVSITYIIPSSIQCDISTVPQSFFESHNCAIAVEPTTRCMASSCFFIVGAQRVRRHKSATAWFGVGECAGDMCLRKS